MMPSRTRIVALVPAAGSARRLAPLPMSKELYPIGFGAASETHRGPKVVSQYLLERMATAGITEAFIIIRPGKWDIPAFFGDGGSVGIRLAYLTVDVPFGVPFTLDQAYPFVRDATVALGFPDLLFWPETAFRLILDRLRTSTADVVLGLFPTDEPQRVGVVELSGGNGTVLGIYEKSTRTDLSLMWGMAVWRPGFTEFLHEFVEAQRRTMVEESAQKSPGSGPAFKEIPIGDVVHAGIRAGLKVEAEILPEGRCIDVGTPESLREALALHLGSR
jgi:glucose-1-phosphate thymidylyltransferase